MDGRATLSHMHKTSMHTHRGSCGVLENTRSLSGTYCTIPPVILLLINTHTQANTRTWHGFVEECMADEKEFKGIALALGKEKRMRQGERMARKEDEVTWSQSVFSFQSTKHLSLWRLTCKRLHRHTAIFALHVLYIDFSLWVCRLLLLLPPSRRGLITKHSTDSWVNNGPVT